MATRTRRTPVTGGFARPVIASLDMIEFIREGDFGVLYGPNGEIISDDVKDILVFLDPQITGEDGRLEDNVFYKITARDILLSLFVIYITHHNLKNNDGTVTADDLMKKYFGTYIEEIRIRGTNRTVLNADNFRFNDLGKLIYLSVISDIDELRQFFPEQASAQQKNQIDQYTEQLEIYEGKSQIIPYLEIATEVVTGDKSDDISMVYEVNPPLYAKAMNDNILQYVSATHRYLVTLEQERRQGRFIKAARR